MNFKRMCRALFLGIILCLSPEALFPQKMVADTLVVDFSPGTGILTIEEANDLRGVPPRFLSVYEKKKWLFFPVDQIVNTRYPLNRHFTERFHSDSAGISRFSINIHHFDIKHNSSLFDRQLKLFATLGLSSFDDEGDSCFLGTFYYEYPVVRKKKEDIVTGYGFLLENWAGRFERDILSAENGLDTLTGTLYYFRRGQEAVQKNFYTSLEFFYGLNFWGIDGELWFSQPEGNIIFNRGSGLIRYVNHPTFQAIAIGSNVRRWNYRLDPHWLFTNKMALLMGINNWKDMKTTGHKLEEIFYFNASMCQQISFNPLDRPGIVFGVGVMEDLHYVIYHEIKLNIGISVHCAYKF